MNEMQERALWAAAMRADGKRMKEIGAIMGVTPCWAGHLVRQGNRLPPVLAREDEERARRRNHPLRDLRLITSNFNALCADLVRREKAEKALDSYIQTFLEEEEAEWKD